MPNLSRRDATQPADMTDVKWAIAREIPHLRRYARALAHDPGAADDLVQDCLERALRKRHLWRRTGSMRSWLFRILYTTYLNGLERRRRRGSTVEIDGRDDYGAVPAAQESSLHCRDVLAGLAELPDEQRVTVLLVALDGMSYTDVANVLGVPIGTVRSRLWRGREALRKLAPPADPVVRLRKVK